MTQTGTWRTARPLALFVLLVMLLSLVIVVPAGAEGAPLDQAPGYPKAGCYDLEVRGAGMWAGSGYASLDITVPGPVVDAYLVWAGTEDVGAPDSPNNSDLSVNGTAVTGRLVDRKKYGPISSEWFMWRADVGPNGYNLVQQGANSYTISGWSTVADDIRRNGASLMVVYSTGACTTPKQINLGSEMDWYWENTLGEETTGAVVFQFDSAATERTVTLFLNHAGTDHATPCRPNNVWGAWGAGAAPNNIINYGMPSKGINGGQLLVTDPFGRYYDCGTTTYPPVTEYFGGYIGAEWSVTRLKLTIPAGTTWLAVQGESVETNAQETAEMGESGAWFVQAAVPLANPELRISKTDNTDTAAPGDTLTYTINYENYGYGPANDTVILDTLPERVSYVSATNGGVYDAATRTVRWELGTVNLGVSGQVAVTVKLDPVFPNGVTTLTNTANISTSSAGDTNSADNAASDTTTVNAQAQLSIEKTGAPEPVDAGANLTYTVDWTVGGNAFTQNVTIVDKLPANVAFVNATDAGLYDPTTHTVTWLLGDVTPVTTGTYQVTVAVDSPLYNGTIITNSVTITDAAGDTASDDFANTVRAGHVLDVEKTGAPDPVNAGANLTYTIDWTVTGNEPADNATIVDTLPADVTLVDAGGGTYDATAHTITWSLGKVLPPDSGSFTVVVTVDSPMYDGTLLTNVVRFTDDTPGSTPDEDTTVTTVHADHELTIEKDDSPDPVEKGGNLTYTITWGVSGTEPADNIVITDTIPFGTQFVSASDGGLYDAALRIVTWAIGDKLPGDTGTVTLVVKVNADFPNGLSIENTVNVSDDKVGKEEKSSEETEVVQTPEGTVGDTVWYDYNRNGIREPNEPGLGGVTVTLSLAGADGVCSADDTAVATTMTDPNGRYLFTGVAAGVYCARVDDTTLPDGLSLVSGTDPHGPINLAEGQAYLTADFGYASDQAIGDRVWSDADGDGVQDPGEAGIGGVPVVLVAAGADGQCANADDTVVATTTTNAAGNYLFTGMPAGVYCVMVTVTIDIIGDAPQTGGTNPHGPITLDAGETYLDADFGYQRQCVTIGDFIFYDANRNGVYDGGPSERGFSGITLSLLAPGPDGTLGTADDVTVATATTNATGAYLFTGLAPGSYWVVITDLNNRLEGYTQTYGAPNTNNNGQVSPYPVTIEACGSVLTADFAYADGHVLTVTKTNDLPAGQPVEAGAELTWTITYSQAGREPAPNVVLTDYLPMQVDFVSCSDDCTYDPVTRTVRWNLGNLNPGDEGTRTLTVKVKRPLPNQSYIFNTVVILDDAGVRDEATDVVRVHAEPILSLTKTNVPTGTVEPGDTIAYELCYANTGNGNATNVVLTDVIPMDTTYVPGSATGSPTYSAATRTLTWNIGELTVDVETCVQFKVTVNMAISGVTETPQTFTITNTATLTSREKPALTATATNSLTAFVKPSLTKFADPVGEVMPGDTIKYTVCYGNTGNASLTGAMLTDPIPTNTTYVPGSATGGPTYDEATRTLTWKLGVIEPGESACFTFQVTVNMTIVGLTGQASAPLSFAEWTALTIDNIVTLATDQVPDKTAQTSNPLNATVMPEIYKTVDRSQVWVAVGHQETIVFTVRLTNSGTANATNVVVTDMIHPKLVEVTVATTRGTATYDTVTRMMTANVGTVEPGAEVIITIRGKTEPVTAGTPVPFQYTCTNVAVVSCAEGAPRESNEVAVTVRATAPEEIPEPGTLLLLGSGLAGLAGYARTRVQARRRKNG